ncbi:MAG TPA: phosphoadenosine phosphosulfate reductase family protein, partial [Candidatus Acidoferrales bacterium]|nr:phosphoadenosine phosphosulfate reductase family protein [Candidatus Acidoferrales bacterium]
MIDPGAATQRAERSGGRPVIPDDVEHLDAGGVLRLALEQLGHERLAISASFGPEDIVLIDLLTAIEPRARVFTLDTGRLPSETYDLIERIRTRFGIGVEVFAPD